ncbi:MAG TPA: HAMP domain-containing protein, partial [Anaeromyxobacter sp.]
MFTRTTSIRGKIAAGFLLSFGFLLLVAAVMFVSLRQVEDEVGAYSAISRFLDTTLEMRRYEKNYLLYRQREDLEKALEYAGAARAAAPDETTARLLEQYRGLLQHQVGDESLETAAAIRDVGRGITDVAERLAGAEGRKVQELLRSGRRTLIVLVVVFLVGTALIARGIVLTAMRPLEELERGMQRIAAGDYQPLPERGGQGEIGSMNAAFNRMMREVFQHRQDALQSERL